MSPIRPRHRSRGLAALGTLWILMMTAPAFGDVPELLSYQGVLMQDDGIVVEDGGPRDLRFRLYPQELGGTHVFEQTLTVEVRDGLYNVVLSSQGGYELLEVIEDHGNLFMEVTVLAVPDPQNGGQPTTVVLEPRQQLASVPYALSASTSSTSSSAFDPETMHDLVDQGAVGHTAPSTNTVHPVQDASGSADLKARVVAPPSGVWRLDVRALFMWNQEPAQGSRRRHIAGVRVTADADGSSIGPEVTDTWLEYGYAGSKEGNAGTSQLLHAVDELVPGEDYEVRLIYAVSAGASDFTLGPAAEATIAGETPVGCRIEAMFEPYGP